MKGGAANARRLLCAVVICLKICRFCAHTPMAVRGCMGSSAVSNRMQGLHTVCTFVPEWEVEVESALRIALKFYIPVYFMVR